MKKVLVLTLSVEVEDCEPLARLAAAEESDVPVEEMGGLEDYTASEIASLIAGHLEGGDQEELWAGTGTFARLGTVEALKSEWASPAGRAALAGG